MAARKLKRRQSNSDFCHALEARRLLSAGDMKMALTAGGAGNDMGKSTAVDAAGNVYSFGIFSGSASFGGQNLVASGATDDFLAKYSPSGKLVWARQIGGAGAEDAGRVTVDAAGNVFVIGYFQGTADLDPGPGAAMLTATGTTDAFVEKLDSNGNFLWARAMTGPKSDAGVDVATDAAGNVFAAITIKVSGYRPGGAKGDIAPDPDGLVPGQLPEPTELAAPITRAANRIEPTGTVTLTGLAARDSYVIKFNANGQLQWTAGLNGASNDIVTGLAVDSGGNVIATGYFLGEMDFDPGPGTMIMQPTGGNDTFIWKLDGQGQLMFAGQVGGWSQEIALDVATDRSDNIFVTGYFFDGATFGSGANATTLSGSGGEDMFVAKYAPGGNLIFARAIGGAGDESASGIAIDPSGAFIYLAGRFTGSADFDPSSNVRELTSAGAEDVFIAAYSASDGSYSYAKRFGSTGSDSAYGIATDKAGHVFSTGSFIGSVDFDPGPGTSMQTSSGANDVFVTELDAFGSRGGVIRNRAIADWMDKIQSDVSWI